MPCSITAAHVVTQLGTVAQQPMLGRDAPLHCSTHWEGPKKTMPELETHCQFLAGLNRYFVKQRFMRWMSCDSRGSRGGSMRAW